MNTIRKTNSPRGEVGEIDTRAPFQSVKAAVSLFGEVAVSRDRFAVKRRSSEMARIFFVDVFMFVVSKDSHVFQNLQNVFEKETQLILAQKELSKIKRQMDIAEATKAKALSDLESAKMTLHNLTTKLANVRESKQSAMEAAEAVRNETKRFEKALSIKAVGYEAWKQELEHARKEYTTTITELDSSKQEVTKIRQDFDAVLEAKLSALQAVGEAQRSAKLNSERISELSNEIATMKASVEQLKLASEQSQEEHAQDMGQDETHLGFYKTAKEKALENLESLKNEYDPALIQSLHAKLAETGAEIEALQEQIKKVHASKMDSVRLLTSELKEATKTLQQVGEEKNSLTKLVFSLRTELKQVKKEHDEMNEKEQAAKVLGANLTGEIQESMGQARPEPGTVEDFEANIFYDQSVKIKKLQLETEDARREAEEMKIKAQELKQEAEKSRAAAEEAEKRLELVLMDAKEAKAANLRAIKEMKILSEVGKVSTSRFNGKIKMSNEEFESLRGKVKECEDLVQKKEAEAVAELQEIYTRTNEIDRKVETNLKAIEETRAATEVALWNAEMADSAIMAIESELMRLQKQEQEVVADACSSTLEHSDNSSRLIPLTI
ncbi:WEB family protein At1g12150-like [Abrus precatorius]|uniref:WEB family protein At1g12150-like n=1 Tax=Abrus precatorius TaxID=3816 RepID=A0A8B8MM05_ABRPR|nr:WEB family protein At1g12150-like [Abrus precatorius]